MALFFVEFWNYVEYCTKIVCAPYKLSATNSDNVYLPTIPLSLSSLFVSGKDFAYINEDGVWEPIPVTANKAFLFFPILAS
jgi:hypothetical protein